MENNKEEKVKANAKAKMEEYEVIEQIGRGAFGPAYLVMHKLEKERYVLKKNRVSKKIKKFKRTAYHEMNLMAKLSNPCLVEYKDAWVDEVLRDGSYAYLDKVGMKRSKAYVFNGVAMFFAWLVARIFLFMYLFYHLYLHIEQIWTMQTFGQMLALIAPFVIAFMNLMWVGKIIKGLKKTLATKRQ